MEIRKILFVCLLLLLSAICSQALDNDKIVNYYKSFIKSNYGKDDVEVKVVDTETYKGFEVVKVEIGNNGGATTKHFMFVKDNFIFDDIYDLNSAQSLRESLVKDSILKKAKELKEYHKLGKGDKQKWLFLDTECSHCKNEIKNISEILKDTSVNIVLLNIVGGEYGAVKTVHLEKELKGKKNDKDKVAVIEKYFNYNLFDLQATKEEIEAIRNRSKKFVELGLEYVPFIIDIEQGLSK